VIVQAAFYRKFASNHSGSLYTNQRTALALLGLGLGVNCHCSARPGLFCLRSHHGFAQMNIFRSLSFSCLGVLLMAALPIAAQSAPALLNATRSQALAVFQNPDSAYGPNLYYELHNATAESVAQDLDRVKAMGFRAITLQAGRNMPSPYLSSGYFSLIRDVVQQARARDLRVWLVDDAGYPSGFAGGKFSTNAPRLRMQALTLTNSIDLTSGLAFQDVVSPEFVSAIAFNRDTQEVRPLSSAQNHIHFTPPASGHWQVFIADHVYRTSLTRSVTNSTGAKDDSQSLENYLDANATRQYLAFVHEQYQKAIGDEFGRTVLGFRGDEPDFSFFGLPYSADVFAQFKRIKGYDLQPMAAALLLQHPSPQVQRMAADYADVWSMLFRQNFFALQADWCKAHNLRYQVHLNHEDDLPRLAATEGDFLRLMTAVQVPGVDAIWHQIWPGIAPEFPRLAASAAHLSGSTNAFTESFAAYNPQPDLAQARFILNEQIVRGINMVEVMGSLDGKHAAPFLQDPALASMLAHVRRTTALFSQGQPAAQVGLYIPTRNFWLQDDQANQRLLAAATQLSQHQIDYDFIDDDSLCAALQPEAGGLKTASGNLLRTLIIPEDSLLTLPAYNVLQKLLNAGGQVVFLGHAPTAAAATSLRNSVAAPTLSQAQVAPNPEANPAWIRLLPLPGLRTDQPAPQLRLAQRHLSNANLYLLFNESDAALHCNLLLVADANVEQWLPETGATHALSLTANHSLPLDLAPQQTLLLVVTEAGKK